MDITNRNKDNMEKNSPPDDKKHQVIIPSNSDKENILLNAQQMTKSNVNNKSESRVSPMKDDHVLQSLDENAVSGIVNSFSPRITLKACRKSRIPVKINYSSPNIPSLGNNIETATIDLSQMKLYNPRISKAADSFVPSASKSSLDKNAKKSASSSINYNASSSTVSELMIAKNLTRRRNKFAPPLNISESSPIVPQPNKLNNEERNKLSSTGTIPKTSNPFHQLKDMSTLHKDKDLKRYIRKFQSNKYDLLAMAAAVGAKRFSKNKASSTMNSTSSLQNEKNKYIKHVVDICNSYNKKAKNKKPLTLVPDDEPMDVNSKKKISRNGRHDMNQSKKLITSTENEKFIIREDIKKLADYVYLNNSASAEIKNRTTFGLDAAGLLEEISKTEEMYKLPEFPVILDEPTTSKQTKDYSLYEDLGFAEDKTTRELLTAAKHVLLACSLNDKKSSHCSKEEQDADYLY